MTIEAVTPDWLLFARYCWGSPDRGPNDGFVVTGNWSAITAQHSPADLRPVRVRGERERRRVG